MGKRPHNFPNFNITSKTGVKHGTVLLLLGKQGGLLELGQRRLSKMNVNLTSLELNVMFLLGGLKIINSSKRKNCLFTT